MAAAAARPSPRCRRRTSRSKTPWCSSRLPGAPSRRPSRPACATWAGATSRPRAALAAQHPHASGAARIEVRGTLAAFEGDATLELTAGGAIASGAELAPTALTLTAGFAYADERIEVAIDPAPFAIAVQRADETLRVEGETPALSLSLPPTSGGAPLGLHVTTAGGHFRLPDYDFEVRGIAVDADLDPETGLPSGSLRIEALVDTHEPPRLPKLALDGTFEAAAAEVGFDVTAASPGRQLELTVRGTHDLATGSGEARVRMKPVEFEADGLQPAALSPLLGRSIEAASGGVEARGAIAWGGGGGHSRRSRPGDARPQRVLGAGGLRTPERGHSRRGPWPPSTPPGQLVSMARVDFGLELTNGLIAFQIRPDGVLDLASAEWTFAGGTIRTRGATDLTAETQELTLDLDDVDLSELLALVDLEGLSGSGRLEGRIPVVRHGGTLEIRDGKLSGTKEGGWIRYRAAPGIAGVASRQAGFDVTLAALENFRYDELVATRERRHGGPRERLRPPPRQEPGSLRGPADRFHPQPRGPSRGPPPKGDGGLSDPGGDRAAPPEDVGEVPVRHTRFPASRRGEPAGAGRRSTRPIGSGSHRSTREERP